MQNKLELLVIFRQCVKSMDAITNATFIFTHGLDDQSDAGDLFLLVQLLPPTGHDQKKASSCEWAGSESMDDRQTAN